MKKCRLSKRQKMLGHVIFMMLMIILIPIVILFDEMREAQSLDEKAGEILAVENELDQVRLILEMSREDVTEFCEFIATNFHTVLITDFETLCAVN